MLYKDLKSLALVTEEDELDHDYTSTTHTQSYLLSDQMFVTTNTRHFIIMHMYHLCVLIQYLSNQIALMNVYYQIRLLIH